MLNDIWGLCKFTLQIKDTIVSVMPFLVLFTLLSVLITELLVCYKLPYAREVPKQEIDGSKKGDDNTAHIVDNEVFV